MREAFGPVLLRFTDRAIEALAFARLEANARHHPYIAAEHVLLALARVKRGVAREALKHLGLDLTTETGPLEAALAAIAPWGQGTDVARNPTTMQLLGRAESVARALGHNYVGTEHMVLALWTPDGPGASFLSSRGISEERFREEVLSILAG
jgi:ATP-dependent Clp protease ATP-binding subunit ClpC